jgi:hypothetical protein
MEEARVLATEILTWVVSFLGGATGIATIASVVKCALRAKASKMSKKDKQEIAEMASDLVIQKQQATVEVDISAQIDRATNKRIAECEAKTNEFIKDNQNLREIVKGIAIVVSDLKSHARTYTVFARKGKLY